MKYGAAFPYGSARTAANLAQIAEASGWDGIFLGDAIWHQDTMICLAAAAMVTWWVEGLWEASEVSAVARLRLGPPQ